MVEKLRDDAIEVIKREVNDRYGISYSAILDSHELKVYFEALIRQASTKMEYVKELKAKAAKFALIPAQNFKDGVREGRRQVIRDFAENAHDGDKED